MKSKIVGTNFTKTKAEGIQVGSNLSVYHDKENEFDDKALAVIFNDERIGFIGKGTDLYDVGRNMFPMDAIVVDFYIKDEFDDRFSQFQTGELVSLNLEVDDFLELCPTDDVNSFNEIGVIVNFNEETHTYTHNGNILKGATTYIKKYLKPFESELMVDRCSSAWGVEKKTIKKAWELGRDLAATFGTGIHKALEFEDLYRHHEKKSGERCFNIKHPMIKQIVDDFYDFYNSFGFEYSYIVPEALISCVNNGMTALADRVVVIDEVNKICALEDYKVNHTFTDKGKVSFQNLPNGLELETNKLSKLALQLKVQEWMLNKSGWTVVRKTGFVFDGKWNKFNVPNLEGFDIVEGKMINQEQLF